MTSPAPLSPEETQKKAFAIALLHNPDDPFKAATAVFGNDMGSALEVYGVWTTDPIVKQFQKDYIDAHGASSVLPSREDYAREVWTIGKDERVAVEDRLKAMRLYGDIRGFIEKPGTVINANTNVQHNKVMVLQSKGTDEDWERKAIAQQQKLISDAS
jgi:hypothetical protein